MRSKEQIYYIMKKPFFYSTMVATAAALGVSSATALDGSLTPNAGVATFSMEVEANSMFVIKALSEDFDSVLYARTPSGEVLYNDDHEFGAFGTNSQLTIEIKETGALQLVVSSFSGDMEGDFQVEVFRAEKDKDSLQVAEFDAEEIIAEHQENNDFGSGGIALAEYAVELTAGQSVDVELNSDDFDAILAVQLPDGSVVGNDDADGLNSALTLESDADGEAIVVVASYGGEGDYDLIFDPELETAETDADGQAILDDFLEYGFGDSDVWDGDFIDDENIINEAPSREFNSSWFFGEEQEFIDLEGQMMPELPFDQFVWHGEPVTAADLEGKVVVVDFWTTWCPPCRAAIPHNQELAEAHPDDLVILGVCLDDSVETMNNLLDDANATYPAAYAQGGAVAEIEANWVVQFYPTYVVIDREGVVRANGLSPNYVDDVVETLLAEYRNLPVKLLQ